MKRIAGWLSVLAIAVLWRVPVHAQESSNLARQVAILQKEVNRLQSQVVALQTALSSTAMQNALTLGSYISVDPKPEKGLKGPNVILSGVNVHIESGSGSTVDTTGLGNLVIGYDEDEGNSLIDTARTGSHNLVIGPGHEFTASGGFLAGFQNTVVSNYGSVGGGLCNAVGLDATSSCGLLASPGEPGRFPGESASVSGGDANMANGWATSVSGGFSNRASGNAASISGGGQNEANDTGASVGGGSRNVASGVAASVAAGWLNTASGLESSVGGGFSNPASGDDASVSGGESNVASGSMSSVGGGAGRTASHADQNIN